MVSCAACGRANSKKNKEINITYHRFPKNEENKQVWIKFVNKINWAPPSNIFLCSKHFTEDCFDRSSSLKVRLRENAVPTIVIDRLKYIKTNFQEEYFTPTLNYKEDSCVISNSIHIEDIPISSFKTQLGNISDQNLSRSTMNTPPAHSNPEASISTTKEISESSENEISLQKIKVEYTDIFTESLPVINIKQEENSDEEVHLPNSTSNNYVNQPKFIATDTNISSQQISSTNKHANNELVLTNVNSIISHKGCNVFMVTAQKDTNKAISSNELSTINTEVFIKNEIHEEEQDSTLYDSTTDFNEESMVPVTEDESYKSVKTNESTSIFKSTLTTTSNKETLDSSSDSDEKMLTSRDNTMSVEECTTTADIPVSENENFAVVALRNMLKTERSNRYKKVRALQATIHRLRKANAKLMETVKELKLENSLYS